MTPFLRCFYNWSIIRRRCNSVSDIDVPDDLDVSVCEMQQNMISFRNVEIIPDVRLDLSVQECVLCLWVKLWIMMHSVTADKTDPANLGLRSGVLWWESCDTVHLLFYVTVSVCFYIDEFYKWQIPYQRKRIYERGFGRRLRDPSGKPPVMPDLSGSLFKKKIAILTINSENVLTILNLLLNS